MRHPERVVKNERKLWTIILGNNHSYIIFCFYVLLTLLPIYIADRLHVSADKAGLLVTCFLAAAIVIRPFAGQWVGKIFE